MPAVSVIIPVYNTEVYLDECLNSICSQTLKNIEIICINDGSTDNSLAKLKEYSERDGRITVIDQVNCGLSCSRNAGFDLAKGKYIYYLDSDDYLAQDALEILYNSMENEKLDLLLFNTIVFGDQGVEKSRLQNDMDYYTIVHQYPPVCKGVSLFKLLWDHGEYIAPVCVQMFKREFLTGNALRFQEGIIHEDELFTFKCMLLAPRAGYLGKPLYYRRVRQASIMDLNQTEKMVSSVYSCFICVKQMLDFCSSLKIETENEDAVFANIRSICTICRIRYESLDGAGKAEVLQRIGKDIFLFKLLVLEPSDNENLKQLLSEAKQDSEKKKARIVELEKELESVKSGWSFKLGRVVTYFPRKIREGLKQNQIIAPSHDCQVPEKIINSSVQNVLPASRMQTPDNKVTFINWWPCDYKTEWFYQFIKNNTEIKHLTFFSVFGDKNDVLKFASRKDVFFSGENLDSYETFYPDYMDYCLDYVGLSMGFSQRSEANYLRFPLWIPYMFEPVIDKDKIAERVTYINQSRNTGKYECSVINRHDHWNMRTPIYEALKNKLDILCAGEWNNNTSILWDVYQNDKIRFLNDCKFTICSENVDIPYYVTEKLFEAFLGGCIPIYAGADSNPEPGIINLDAVLLWKKGNKENNDSVIQTICDLNRDEQLYKEFISRTKLLSGTVDYVYNKMIILNEKLEALQDS